MNFNVDPRFCGWQVDMIKKDLQSNSLDCSAAMLHVDGDFNLGTMARSANFFSLRNVYYVGGKKSYDRRSCVGVHHYTPVSYIRTEEEFLEFVDKEGYELVAIENNIEEYKEKTLSLFDKSVFYKLKKPMFLFGEESRGIQKNILDKCERIITIPSFGSVRSLNVGSCSTTIFAFYRMYKDSEKEIF